MYVSFNTRPICEYAQYIGVACSFLVSLFCNLLVCRDIDGVCWFPPWGLRKRFDGFDLVGYVLWEGPSNVFEGGDMHFAFRRLCTADCRCDWMLLRRGLHPDKCLENLVADP